MENSSLILNIIILGLGRFLDLFSTWYVTPNFELEVNSWMKKIGWRGVIIINIAITLILPMIVKERAFNVSIISVLAALRNFQVGTMARVLGEEGYRKAYRQYVKDSSWYMPLLPIFFECAIYIAIGATLFMIVGRSEDPNLAYIGMIGTSFFVFGFMIAGIAIGSRVEKMIEKR